MSVIRVHFKVPRVVLYASVLSGVAFFFLIFALYSPKRLHPPRGPHVNRLSPSLERPLLKPCISTDAVGEWEFQAWRDANDYGLSDAQCSAAFPKLFIEIDRAVVRRETNITIADLDSQKPLDGMIRAMIYNGELLILSAQKLLGFHSRGLATLHSLNRALTSFPLRQTLPNIEFILLVEDFSRENVPRWSYSSRSDPSSNIFLMPDFGYWSWPEVGVSSYSHFRRRVLAMDDGLREDGTTIGKIDFHSKKTQLVWRGALRPNPLRGALYELAKGKMWADVQYINWDDPRDVRRKAMKMEEYCRYAFLAHVEGRSYSRRAKYLLNCRSVFVSHKLEWVEAHHGALVAEGPEQNYVEVRRDWGNLEDKIMHLIEHPEVAERIAENSVRTFRDRYLTPAAEACYWRRLVRGWASVSFEPQFYADEGKERWRGLPFESFILTNMTLT